MRETLTTLPTEKQRAINALRLAKDFNPPTVREEFSDFLIDNDITQHLSSLIQAHGRQRDGTLNQNNLLYPSIVSGKLVPAKGENIDYFFATIYPSNPDRQQPARIGLYRKQRPGESVSRPFYKRAMARLALKMSGITNSLARKPEASQNYGLELPIDEDGNLDVEAWLASGYATDSEQAALALNASLHEILSVVENEAPLEIPYTVEQERLAA